MSSPARKSSSIAPPSPGVRKVILSTAIAETSLTIDGVTCVIDSGLAREARYDVGGRMTRLATVRVSRASADQRRGRAGRLGPGHCYRLWAEPETASLPAHSQPEILSSDLSGLVLDCAAWGVPSPRALDWLDPPPTAAIEAAQVDLTGLGALDANGRLTRLGGALRALPLPPHHAAMLVEAARHGQGADAALIAALLSERSLGGNDADLDLRLQRFRTDRSRRATAMRDLAARWAREADAAATRLQDSVPCSIAEHRVLLSTGGLLALAYPDRIAMARGSGGRYLMAGGSGGIVSEDDPLARCRFLVAADLQGAARAGRITAAARIEEDEFEAVAAGRIEDDLEITFDRPALALRARRRRRLGALTLASTPAPLPEDADAATLLAAGIAEAGIAVLPWSKSHLALRARAGFLRAGDPGNWPDLTDAGLAAGIEEWLAPFLSKKTSVAEITADDLSAGLDGLLPWAKRQELDAQAPSHFTAPTGNRHPIDYEGEQAPSVSLRVQELFGLTTHPSVARGRLPLTLILLSPAHRPIQVTRDLPGFWAGSWADVSADLRGRYPKHPWPDDPASASPTARAKPRGH